MLVVVGFLSSVKGVYIFNMYLFYLTAVSFIILSMLCDEISQHLQKKRKEITWTRIPTHQHIYTTSGLT